jgi:hypothetical protein
MEVKIDVVQPNLLVSEDSIYFGMDSSEILPVCRDIDDITSGLGLKVREVDLEVIKNWGSSEGSNRYTTPLKKYLDVLEDKESRGPLNIGEYTISNTNSRFFNLGYIIDAASIEDPSLIDEWNRIRGILEDPDKYFGKMEEEGLVIDRERSLERLRRDQEELAGKFPKDGIAIFLDVIKGGLHYKPKYLGAIEFEKFKGLEGALEPRTDKLVERLKEVRGPSLSLDVMNIHDQMWRLFYDSTHLANSYGDIITTDWRSRLFLVDP